ncbi:MAG: hypothetical protein GF349_02450 [Candidatus Magasanikbacteria bacterium]|nr:hypothetical protein [Candidatus Magasanikbacteria bacterium]
MSDKDREKRGKAIFFDEKERFSLEIGGVTQLFAPPVRMAAWHLFYEDEEESIKFVYQAGEHEDRMEEFFRRFGFILQRAMVLGEVVERLAEGWCEREFFIKAQSIKFEGKFGRSSKS